MDDYFFDVFMNLYGSRLERYYLNNIDKEFTSSSLNELFKWKNQMKLSSKKHKSLKNKVLCKRNVQYLNICRKSQDFEYDEFLLKFKDVGPYWKCFLFHLVDPTENPIFDRNVYEAYNYFNHSNIPIEKDVLNFYLKTYKPWINSLKNKHNYTLKEIDQALFVFGRLLIVKKRVRFFECAF